MSAVVQQRAQVGERQHQHAEHAVGAVDQREALLLGQLDRVDAVRRRSASAASTQRSVGVAHLALAHHRERAVRQRREVAGAAQRAVLVHDRGDAGVEHRGVGLGGLEPHAGAAGGQRGQPQQHQRPHHLALDLGPGPGRVRADQAALQLGAPLRRDVRGGERAEAGRDAVVRRSSSASASTTPGCGRSRRAPRRPADAVPVPGDADDVVGTHRADPHDDLVGVHGPNRTPRRRRRPRPRRPVVSGIPDSSHQGGSGYT